MPFIEKVAFSSQEPVPKSAKRVLKPSGVISQRPSSKLLQVLCFTKGVVVGMRTEKARPLRFLPVAVPVWEVYEPVLPVPVN